MKLVAIVMMGLTMWAGTVEDARKLLSDAAHAKEGDQRKETAIALSLVPARDPAAALLEQLLKDKDYMVRSAAVDSLGELNDKTRVILMKEMLNDEVPEVAFGAAKALHAMKVEEGTAALQAIYEGEIKAKSNFFKKEMMMSLRRLKTPRSALLFTVEHGIGFVPMPGVGAGYSALMGMMADGDFSARAVSLVLVCRETGKTCGEMLGAAFGDEDWTVRAAAAHVVATKNLSEMKGKLGELLSDKKEKVRLRAAAGYLRMEAAKAVGKPTKAKKKA